MVSRSTSSSRTTYTSTSERSVSIPRAADPLRTTPTIDGSSRDISSSRAARAPALITDRDASEEHRGPPSDSAQAPRLPGALRFDRGEAPGPDLGPSLRLHRARRGRRRRGPTGGHPAPGGGGGRPMAG